MERFHEFSSSNFGQSGDTVVTIAQDPDSCTAVFISGLIELGEEAVQGSDQVFTRQNSRQGGKAFDVRIKHGDVVETVNVLSRGVHRRLNGLGLI